MDTEDQKRDAHYFACLHSGPLADLKREVDAVKVDVQALKDEHTKEQGARLANAKVITYVVAAGALFQAVIAAAALLLAHWHY